MLATTLRLRARSSPFNPLLHLIHHEDDSTTSHLKTKVYISPRRVYSAEVKQKSKPPGNGWIELVPGIVASAAVMQLGFGAADALGKGLMVAQGIEMAEGAASPISGIPCSILLGLLLSNTLPLPKTITPGVKFCQKAVLQMGVVCVGIKLSAVDVLTVGLVGLPAVACCIASGLTFVPWFGNKLGLPKRMSTLIAAGTSICGVTAITALAPAIKANEQETSFAVANVVAFGTLGMLTYPYLAHSLIESSHQIGMFLGLAVHDTSQVIGSALTYSTVYEDEEVLKVAAITKLSRNLFLAAVIPTLTYYHATSEKTTTQLSASDDKPSMLPSLKEVSQYVPAFVVGFVTMSLVRTLGDISLDQYDTAFGMLTSSQWKETTSFIGSDLGSRYLLGTAMAAVGLGTSAAALKGVGYKPFVVGMAGAGVVGTVGFTTTTIIGTYFL